MRVIASEIGVDDHAALDSPFEQQTCCCDRLFQGNLAHNGVNDLCVNLPCESFPGRKPLRQKRIHAVYARERDAAQN